MSRLAHRRGRPSGYRNSLKSDPDWEEVKFKIRNRDNHACVCCGKAHGFEIHHIAYCVNGISIRGAELMNLSWLILVCEDCHQAIHDNPNHPLNPKNTNKLNADQFKQRN